MPQQVSLAARQPAEPSSGQKPATIDNSKQRASLILFGAGDANVANGNGGVNPRQTNGTQHNILATPISNNKSAIAATVNATATTATTSMTSTMAATTVATTTATMAKPNGLKNRILQRPPPLILDKVSNFYDNEIQSNISPTPSQRTSAAAVPPPPTTATTANNAYQQQAAATKQTQQNETNQNNGNNNGNSANHKFWASLNQNASRTRAHVTVPTSAATPTIDAATTPPPPPPPPLPSQSQTPSQQTVSRHLNPAATIVVQEQHSNANSVCAANTKDSSTTATTSSLGADLIITHRNSSTATNSSAALPTISRASTSSANKQQSLPALKGASNERLLPPSPLSSAATTTAPLISQQQKQQPPLPPAPSANPNEDPAIVLVANRGDDTKKPHDMSNNSEHDDSSTHIVHENGGGNLIGVDNPTPPASADAHLNNEPPPSATSSRPRSNNPFLSVDGELLLDGQNTNFISTNHFHQRPASFIAATDVSPANHNQRHQQQRLTFQQQEVISSNRLQVQEQFNNMHLDEHSRPLHHSMHVIQQQDNLYSSDAALVDQQQHELELQNCDQQDGSMYKQQLRAQQQHLLQQQSIYGVYGQNSNYINYEPTLSVDSENTAIRAPPKTTMQLPHWTDAIYERNNAALDINSVAGGSENGEFLHIVVNGDIVLELDHIKVSGFTLAEFNELVGSKPVHLFKAVQTKHSHGITTDLKRYLNCSFPKDSIDKELQDLIRENIYRRTVPCTTRPPKKGEVDKVDYHFLSKEQFVEMNNRGMLLECGIFGGHYYGTMRPFSDIDSLSTYGSLNQKEISDDMRQPLNANHPAIGLASALRKEVAQASSPLVPINAEENLYENQASLEMFQMQNANIGHAQQPPEMVRAPHNQRILPPMDNGNIIPAMKQQSSIVAVDSEALPHGWERVIDQTYGTYYIDHNTQHTQYERPYEIELTKGAMGFGFTLVEAENGCLLVRSVIPGGPAHLNGTIRPGDILISAVGVSVAGLQHTDIARLFSTFAVGDRVRLTFARSTYVVDTNLVPDEYLFSNGTNGDLAVAVNPNSYYNYFNQNMVSQSSQILVNQEFEFITVTLQRGDQGFGFTISDSVAGQKVKKIQNNETCTNLRQGDILISLNGQDITKLTHKEVVDRLKNCPAGKDATFSVKRKKRFRSKTPMAMHTENEEYSLDNTPQRNCKTPSLDVLMLRRSTINNIDESTSNAIFSQPPISRPTQIVEHHNVPEEYRSLPVEHVIDSQSIYGINPAITSFENYYNQQPHHMSLPPQLNAHNLSYRPPSIATSDGLVMDNMTNSVNPSDTSMPPMKFVDVGNLSQMNKYNNFMNNDKLVMMQMQQPRYRHAVQPPTTIQNSDYHPMPLYTNSDILKAEATMPVPIPPKPVSRYVPETYDSSYQNNFYANNEEIALQRVQYGGFNNGMSQSGNQAASFHPTTNYSALTHDLHELQDQDEHEYHQVDLDRGNTDSNWGIRLIGGSESDPVIRIGSIVFGGAASKNGRLKSGDEIISINNINVVGAAHHHVVELISACSSRASLVVRRKKFAEACEIMLTRNMDEGFGFVIISSGNCALIGRIIEGSPADRCQQLHVRDRIIAVNGRYITPDMQHPEIVNMIKECRSTLRLRIIPADCYTVELIKSAQNENFGFSMRGGSEYDGTPLYILRVAPNGLARDLLNVGDQIIEINNIPTVGMTHQQAATIIKHSELIVKLKLRRNYTTPPSLLVDSPRALQKFNQVTAEMKTVNLNSTATGYLTHDGSTSDHSGPSSQHHSSLVEQKYKPRTLPQCNESPNDEFQREDGLEGGSTK